MKEHRLTETYAKDLRNFIEHTDEKQVLFAALRRRILMSGARSMLDIGAGGGEMAVPLAALVPYYLAVEPNLDFVDGLGGCGIPVVVDSFPCNIPSKFDIVLASHVVPWGLAESTAFLRAARALLKPHGTFVMITYDEEAQSDWGDLLRASGLPIPRVGQGRFEDYKTILRGWGVLQIQEIETRVKAGFLDEILEALAFVYADGRAEKRAAFCENAVVRKTLAEKYRMTSGYSFPFTHYLMQTWVK